MKVLVVGANGQIGSQLVQFLHASEKYTVRAMVRREEQVKLLESQGIEAVRADLEGSIDEIAEVAKGCDVIVFTAGSGGHTGADKTLLIDLDGAVKTVEAAEKAGIDRFIMVSALQAHHRENWNVKIRPYYVAKHYADRVLAQSNLTYTILRPGGLLNEPGTGKVSIAENLERSFIPREDVARTILAVIDEERTFNRSFDLVSGDTAIKDALQSL